jgi:hypothetical protein
MIAGYQSCDASGIGVISELQVWLCWLDGLLMLIDDVSTSSRQYMHAQAVRAAIADVAVWRGPLFLVRLRAVIIHYTSATTANSMSPNLLSEISNKSRNAACCAAA